MAGTWPIGSNPYPYPNPTLTLTHTRTLTRTLPLSLTLSRYVVHRVEDGEPILREEVILDEVAVGAAAELAYRWRSSCPSPSAVALASIALPQRALAALGRDALARRAARLLAALESTRARLRDLGADLGADLAGDLGGDLGALN